MTRYLHRLALIFGLMLTTLASAAQRPPAVPARDALDSLAIWVPPGEGRPFLLANRTGTYLYGATGSAWDSGWMGLWVKRERVLRELRVVNAAGEPVDMSTAWCRVTPADVTWFWPREDRQFSLYFASARDTLYYAGSEGLWIQGEPWVQYAPPELADRLLLRAELLEELRRLRFHSADVNLNKAAAWAHFQLLFLLAEGDSLLYAGIPWFNEGWGRDTFISLPGLLVTGHAAAARNILVRFGEWVDRDPQSPTYGRVPNRARSGEDIIYNTADGTPWWILGIYHYGLYARDYALWQQMFRAPSDSVAAGPAFLAMQGMLARRDSLGLPVHGDAETWMDAVGPRGAHSPRGNRAVEIAALEFAATEAAIRMAAGTQAVPGDTLARWRDSYQKLRQSFLAHYLAPSQDRLYDHLNPDGSPDTLLRPNQLFALTVPLSPLVPPELHRRIAAAVSRELIRPYGVLSLSPDAPNFHPYHQDEHYPKDNAYHQGIVWNWLAGPAQTVLTRQGRGDLALELLDFHTGLLLERGLVGSLPEVMDALPRGKSKVPELSGTATQAWSLAEYLRVLYQDFLGVRPVSVRGRVEPFWLIDPRLPRDWGRVEARVFLEGTPVLIAAQNLGDSVVVDVQAENVPREPLAIKVFDENAGVTGHLNGTDPVHLVYTARDSTITADGTPTAQVKLRGWPYDPGPQDIQLARPVKPQGWQSIRPPEWDVLKARDAVSDPDFWQRPHVKIIAVGGDTTERDGDLGGYTYPLDANFAPGILDVYKFVIAEDLNQYHFQLRLVDLVQPGWHPEYGFQLTFAAICLHTPGGKRHEVGANSRYVFPDSLPCSRIIYVGGGFRIEDDAGTTLAQFTPRTVAHALGDTARGTISFSIPKRYFPKYSKDWSWTVLIGAQDDHGGAGMGEFREVKAEAERWAGGGNPHAGPNVYDVLYVPRWRPTASRTVH